MWIGPYNVAFSPPADFQDWTRYEFTEPTGREYLKAGYGSVPNSAKTAMDVMTQRAHELDDLKDYDKEAVVEPVLPARIGKLTGAFVSYTAHEGHFQFREWWAIALLSKDSFVQIVYSAPALDPAGLIRLSSILDSVGPGEETPPRPAAGGFTRRIAGRIALDVPAKLTPPSIFSFDSRDGNVSLELSIFPRPVLWTFPAGVISERGFESAIVDHMPSTIQSFVLTNTGSGGYEHSQYVYGEVRFDDEVMVHIQGRAPAEMSDKLNGPFREMLQSVHRLE